METTYSFNHLLGTRDDGTKTARLELLCNGILEKSFNSNDEIQAFITACVHGRDYLMDIANQTHLHTTPSSAPSVFRNLGEEMVELEAIESFAAARKFPL